MKAIVTISIFLMSIILVPISIVADEVYYQDTPPYQASVLPDYDEAQVRARCDAAGLQPIEGIWFYPDEMMTVVIERFSSPQYSKQFSYRIVLVSSDDAMLLPGTVIGYGASSVDSHKFNLWIYGEQNDEGELSNPHKCVASLDDDCSQLIFSRSEWKIKVRVNFARFLPTLFRGVSVVPDKVVTKVPEGFRKVYPLTDTGASTSDEIRYL